MTCNCIHNSVCRHRIAIAEAIGPISNKPFGPPTFDMASMQKAIEDACRFRVEGKP